MSETPLHTIIEASDFAGTGMRHAEDGRQGKDGRTPLPWRHYLRCIFLTAIILAVLYMTYRPSLLRLSVIMSMVSPSRGENLAWRPEPGEITRTRTVRRTPSPPEWRLTATHTAVRSANRPVSSFDKHWQGNSLAGAVWGRPSGNPWNWSDDVATPLQRNNAPVLTPAQQPATSFRTADNAAWAALAGIGLDVPALQSMSSVPQGAQSGGAASLQPLPSPVPLAPLPTWPPLAATTPASPDGGKERESRSPGLALPPSPFSPLTAIAAPQTESSREVSSRMPSQEHPPASEALVSSTAGTMVNVFQLPPLPAAVAANIPAASMAALGNDAQTAGSASAAPLTPAPGIASPIQPDSPASQAPSASGQPVIPDKTEAESRLDSMPSIRLPDTVESSPVAQTATVIDPVPATTTSSPAATTEDPFAVGSVIVSAPVSLHPETETAVQDGQPASTPETTMPTGRSDTAGSLRPATTTAVADTAAPTQTAAPETADWINSEITAAIPGAYLTIYPKLKFIGLCVPGQGYIRKYNQVAVPLDLGQEKLYAADGRTPYGKYYIARHQRDASGPKLLLSWPSVDDARRIGLGAQPLSEIERAWQNQSLPPQDTQAGGGVALTGDREQLDATSGGFALEEPHMEEIFTALPDGAWVFVQQ